MDVSKAVLDGIRVTIAHLAIPIDQVREHPANPNHGDMAAIKESLRVHGQYVPVVFNRRPGVASSGCLVKGNHTYRAMRELGHTSIAAVPVDVDDEQATRILIADNRTSDLHTPDDAALVSLLRDLPDLAGTGYDEQALADLAATLDAGGDGTALSGDPDAVPDLAAGEPITKRGDLILLGKHRLLCGDSTVLAEVDRLMGGHHAALVFTDPPYGVDYTGGTKVHERLVNDHRGTDIYAAIMPVVLAHADQRAPLYLWHADRASMPVLAALHAAGYEVRAQIIWNKQIAQFGALGAQYKQKHEPCFYAFRKGEVPYWYGPTNEVTVWDVDRARTNEFHSTQKPVALSERALGNSSRPGDSVLDLFGGSGSTLIGCESTGRICFMMELDPRYCDVIIARWEQATGQTATRLS